MQEFTQKAVNTFVGGLITEAGELTFPPNASVDELNMMLVRDGSRRRRLAMHLEDSYTLMDGVHSDGLLVSTAYWDNVRGEPGKSYIIVQRGASLYFFIHGVDPVSGNGVTESDSSSTIYVVDLNTFVRSGGSPSTAPIQAASINGGVVIASAEINTFYITQASDGSFTETEIDFRVRDFSWQGDKSTYFDEVSDASVSAGRKYDTANCGWTDTKGSAALSTWRTANSSKWPALSLPWYAGKDANNDFSATEWDRTEGGTSLITNGHYILDLYSKDRSTASGYSITTETETSRFKTVATYAGRVFYAGMESGTNASRIYFSKIDEEIDNIGDCFQVNDPTSEDFSDLLDTDGGFIDITEAHNIKKLHVWGPKLYVFAENGVWSIGGVDDVFRATQYSVDKISEEGMGPAESFISADGQPFWWSNVGIHTLTPDQVGIVRHKDLTISTIQTFFENINTNARAEVKGAYDGINKRCYWAYPDNDETIENRLSNILIWDLPLQAFAPWSLTASNSYIVGVVDFKNVGVGDVTYIVVDSSGNQVIDSSSNTVVQDVESQAYSADTKTKFIVKDGNTGQLTFAEFNGTDFLDWGTTDYSSYADAAYDFIGDLTIMKNAPYITVYLKRTETGFTVDNSGYQPIRGSSCTLKAFWDFNTNASSSQEAYRLKLPVVVDENDLTNFDYPETVLSTRLKVRGRGRVLKLRFESSTGKDLHLLGWEVIGARNPRF